MLSIDPIKYPKFNTNKDAPIKELTNKIIASL